MNTNLKILITFLVLSIVIFGFAFGISYIGYLLVIKSGGPKYVGVIVGIAVFLLCGLSANHKK